MMGRRVPTLRYPADRPLRTSATIRAGEDGGGIFRSHASRRRHSVTAHRWFAGIRSAIRRTRGAASGDDLAAFL